MSDEEKEDQPNYQDIDISNNEIMNLVQNIFNELINESSQEPMFIRSRGNRIREMFQNDHMPPPSVSPPINRVLESSLYEQHSYKNVVSDEGIKQMLLTTYKETTKTNTACPILQTEFTEDESVIELPCHHLYNPEAIERWLKEESNECPVCRFQLKSKEIKNITTAAPPSQTQTQPNTHRRHYIDNPMGRYFMERFMNQIPIHRRGAMEEENDVYFENDLQQAILNSMSPDDN